MSDSKKAKFNVRVLDSKGNVIPAGTTLELQELRSFLEKVYAERKALADRAS